MAIRPNKAAMLPSPKARLTISPVPTPTPAPNEVLIRLSAAAINPADWGMQALDVLINSYPYILGADGAGHVEAVGASVAHLGPGDAVCALFDNLTPQDGAHGAFQRYAVADAAVCARVPANVAVADAAVLPLGVATAAAGLFQKDGLGLPLPRVEPVVRGGEKKMVVVWGASSSVGACAVQLVRAAGLEVAAVAGGRNARFCEDLGARWVFDREGDGVVDEIVEALRGVESAGVFHAVGEEEENLRKCAQIASTLGGNKFVSTVNPPFRPLPKGLPEYVKFGPIYSTTIIKNGVGMAVFRNWLTEALEVGQMKCKPDKLVYGSGLGALQGAIDRWKEGVSAQKVVVTGIDTESD